MRGLYTDGIMANVRQALGLDENDTSKDDVIMEMEPEEVLDAYLTYEGIIGFTETIIEVVEEVYDCSLDERVFRDKGN